MEYEQWFSTFFYQNWSFFAPPPQSNDRIYYHYYTADGRMMSYEAMEALQEERKRQFLFNDDLSTLDNILSNCVIGLNKFNAENYDIHKLEACNGISDAECYQCYLDASIEDLRDLPELQTLSNYGKIIQQKNRIPSDYVHYSITITNKKTPKFADRHKAVSDEETLIYESELFEL